MNGTRRADGTQRASRPAASGATRAQPDQAEPDDARPDPPAVTQTRPDTHNVHSGNYSRTRETIWCDAP